MENWLLRKIEDAHADSADDLIASNLTSIRSGRTMAEIAAGAPAISLKGKKGKAFDAEMAQDDRAVPAKRRARAGADRPTPVKPPQRATLADDVPTGNGGMHESKYEG